MVIHNNSIIRFIKLHDDFMGEDNDREKISKYKRKCMIALVFFLYINFFSITSTSKNVL